jgi:thioredoxin 1
MAEMKQNGWKVVFWVIFALAVLGGIVYFAWNRTDEPATTNTVTTDSEPTCDQKSTKLTEYDELNENEVEFTACNFEEEVIQAKGVVLIDAYASWCGHCQKLSPVIAQLANDYVGRAKVGKLNANNQDPAMKENFDFAVSKGLTGYPTVWIYKDGVLVDSFSGERTYDEIKELLDKQL